jgi:predicted ribosomally synthesized peptide with nif11-like leader
MSIKALEEFYDKVRTNSTLEAEATAALQQGPAAVVALGAREGFAFTSDELAAGLEKLSAGQELSDKDLDLVAGGIVSLPGPKGPLKHGMDGFY